MYLYYIISVVQDTRFELIVSKTSGLQPPLAPYENNLAEAKPYYYGRIYIIPSSSSSSKAVFLCSMYLKADMAYNVINTPKIAIAPSILRSSSIFFI